ncbi:MAG: DUF2306 domain-containing protein, partial [Saprospiraceae bacterium]|nr:DUF2306 domain-containing protein [Saprospiraceae bacterium]
MRQLRLALCLFLAVGIAFVSMRFLDFQPKDILLDKGALADHPVYLIGFYTHVGLGILALLSGPFQFMDKLRVRQLTWHRTLGKVYVVCCLLSGLAGFGIAWFANERWVTSFGFAALAVAWVWTTGRAYRHILAGQVELHRQWMYRSFALTFAAVTLRLWLPLMTFGLKWSFATSYQIVSWLCWVPNLLLIEIWLRRQRKEADFQRAVGG